MLTASLQGTIPATILFNVSLGPDGPTLNCQRVIDHELVRSGKAREYLREQVTQSMTGLRAAVDLAPELLARVQEILIEQFDGVMDGLEKPAA